MNGAKETNVSIIGAGALGGAVALGLHKAGCKVLASDPYPERLGRLRENGVELISDNSKAIKDGEVIMFALKPHLILDIVSEYASLLTGKLCISLAAAVTLDMLSKATSSQVRWARAMSSICAALNCAFTGISKSSNITVADMAWMKEAFGLLGTAEETDEKNLNALTALTGAAPAFFMSLMEATAMGGIQSGIPKDIAYKAAAYSLLGTAKLFIENDGKHPASYRDDVCTPAGMTIEGIYEIERSGARAAMMKAIALTAEKGKIMTDKIACSLK